MLDAITKTYSISSDKLPFVMTECCEKSPAQCTNVQENNVDNNDNLLTPIASGHSHTHIYICSVDDEVKVNVGEAQKEKENVEEVIYEDDGSGGDSGGMMIVGVVK